MVHTKTPQWGLKSVQMSHPPGQHLFHFPVNELQMPLFNSAIHNLKKNLIFQHSFNNNGTSNITYFMITYLYHLLKLLTKIFLAMRCLWSLNDQ